MSRFETAKRLVEYHLPVLVKRWPQEQVIVLNGGQPVSYDGNGTILIGDQETDWGAGRLALHEACHWIVAGDCVVDEMEPDCRRRPQWGLRRMALPDAAEIERRVSDLEIPLHARVFGFAATCNIFVPLLNTLPAEAVSRVERYASPASMADAWRRFATLGGAFAPPALRWMRAPPHQGPKGAPVASSQPRGLDRTCSSRG